MTADIRAAARREAQRLSDATSDVTKQGLEWEWGFADGAVWAQARLTPTRDELAMIVATFFGPNDTPEDVADAILEQIQVREEGASMPR